MRSISVTALKSPEIITEGTDIIDTLFQSMKLENFSLEKGDVIVISTKVVSMEEKRVVNLNTIEVSEEAKKLAEKTSIEAPLAELILQQSTEIIGCMNKSILVKSNYGIFSNAGIDTSNIPKGYALLLPENCNRSAMKYYKRIGDRVGFPVPVILVDTKSIPMRWGSMGIALGYAGLRPLIDYRGKVDLFGNIIKFSMRGIADNIATIGTVVMGETAEQTPFAVVRGIEYQSSESQETKLDIDPENCLYFGPFIRRLQTK